MGACNPTLVEPSLQVSKRPPPSAASALSQAQPTADDEQEPASSTAQVPAEETSIAEGETLEVTIPEGATPGTLLRAEAPDGTVVQTPVPEGIAAGQSISVQYMPAPQKTNQTNKHGKSLFDSTNYKGLAGRLVSKATQVTIDKTGRSPEEWLAHAKESLEKTSAEFKSKLTSQMDSALSCSDDKRINSLLDSALAASLMREGAPTVVQKAANQVASRQLKAAITAQNPKQLKGALVAARRLNATQVGEFAQAAQKYKELKKLPSGFDVERMVLHRKGNRMVAKMEVNEASVKSKFQRLLDLTHRKVYTRDRLGQPVPERLELVSVNTVTNDDMWADYMARRETVRQELAEDPKGFEPYEVDTIAKAVPEYAAAGDAADSIAEALASDFAEPLLREANEVFLFHGTSAEAADKITTGYFNINLAGSSAGTLYGRGVYLAENATKSDEYSRPSANGYRHLLVCRATLGRVFYTDAKDADPRECEAACLKGNFHSVLGDRRKCRGTFREFILFDEEQVYPNYILRYRRVEGKADEKRSMQVTCPLTASPGKTLQVKSPDGLLIHVLVPPGIKPGQKFVVQY